MRSSYSISSILAGPLLSFQSAARVDLMCPKSKRREMGHCGTRPEWSSFGADHTDFHNTGVPLERRARTVQQPPPRMNISETHAVSSFPPWPRVNAGLAPCFLAPEDVSESRIDCIVEFPKSLFYGL